ncbi:MAG: NAD-dependent epimerase/dehydratase family protein [Desulfovibrionaceae bacterium]
MRRVLLTGAGGFLGGAAMEALSALPGVRLVATARRPLPALPPGVEFIEADLADPEAPDALLAPGPCDAVVHCAAFIGSGNTGEELEAALAANVAATARLARACAGSGTRRFVFCSTTNIYGDVARENAPKAGVPETAPERPGNVYAWSKLASEAHLRLVAERTGMEAACLRLAGLHGPGRGAGMVFHMVKNALAGETLRVNEPGSAFTPLFARDAARALALAVGMPMPEEFGICNVAGDGPVTLAELAERVVRLADSTSTIELAAHAPERFQVFDGSAFAAASGFAPAPLEERLKESVEAQRKA